MTRSLARSLPWLLAAVLAHASAAAQPAPPKPQSADKGDKDDGKDRFAKGVTLFREGDFAGALVEFRRAHELLKDYRVLYNVGQTQLELHDYAGALATLERYLTEGGAEIDAKRRADVEADLAKLEHRVARVEITVSAPGADVLVDDVVVGKSPLKGPILVSMGQRKIAATRADGTTTTRVVELAGGDRTKVTLDVSAPAPTKPDLPATPPPAPRPEPPSTPQESPSHAGIYVGLAATGALAVGAVVTGVLALSAKSDATTKLGTLGVAAADVKNAHDKAQTLGLVTDILGGAAIVAGGVTLVVGLTSSSKSRERSASLVLGPSRASLQGTF